MVLLRRRVPDHSHVRIINTTLTLAGWAGHKLDCMSSRARARVGALWRVCIWGVLQLPRDDDDGVPFSNPPPVPSRPPPLLGTRHPRRLYT